MIFPNPVTALFIVLLHYISNFGFSLETQQEKYYLTASLQVR